GLLQARFYSGNIIIMLWTIIAVAVSGLGAAGIALLLRKLRGNRLPKWLIPVFAGAGMPAYQSSAEYSSTEHQSASQPEGPLVVATEQNPEIWRAWTFHIPMTNAYTVLDTNRIDKRVAGNDTVASFILYRFEKQHVDRVVPQAYLLNCTTAELVPLKSPSEPDAQSEEHTSELQIGR